MEMNEKFHIEILHNDEKRLLITKGANINLEFADRIFSLQEAGYEPEMPKCPSFLENELRSENLKCLQELF
jgi:hypothetical protein